MKTALTIAGSDCSGGSSIQADIKTMMAHGVYGMSAITALTAQNTLGVHDIYEVTPAFLEAQLDAVFSDITPDAVKVGMVANSELIKSISRKLQQYEVKNLVVDLVMVSASGVELIKEEAIDTLQEELLQLADVITPSLPEAEVLADMDVESQEDMLTAAKKLHGLYGCSVVIKGGHDLTDGDDLLYTDEGAIWLKGAKLGDDNAHGLGCTFSSAITANLANGLPLEDAVRNAIAYVGNAQACRFRPGKGMSVMDHLLTKLDEVPED